MSFLSDFHFYASGFEIPEPYVTWSGISLLNMIAGKKIWAMHGDIKLDGRLYICMIGSPNSGKSSAMEQSENLFLETFPDYLISESIQSREDLLNKMTTQQCEKVVQLADGSFLAWRPFYCLIDEMENFVSVGNSKTEGNKMVATLVGMYNRSSFGTGFKTDANKNQRIHNPYLNLLACSVPEWIMSSLRMSLFVGGLGRRLIIVNAKKTKEIANPRRPAGAAEAYSRMKAHLQIIEKHSGELKKTEEAQKWWDKWYVDPKRKNKVDPILIQFHEGQHTTLLKVAIALALSENPTTTVLEQPVLEASYYMLRELDPEIVRLTSGVGRNELAGVGAQLLDFLDRLGGAVPEIEVRKQFRRYLQDREFIEVLQSYQNTKELFVAVDPNSTPPRTIYFLPYAYERYIAKVAESLRATAAGSPSASATPPGPDRVLGS